MMAHSECTWGCRLFAGCLCAHSPRCRHHLAHPPVTRMRFSRHLDEGWVRMLTVPGLGVRGTSAPRGCARAGAPRPAARTTKSAGKVSCAVATPALQAPGLSVLVGWSREA